MCLRKTLMNYNAAGYASVTDIAMHLRLSVLIDYIFVFRKDRQVIEYTRDQCFDQQHEDVLQWYQNAQNIICYDN